MKFYEITQQGNVADVYIFGDIVSYPYQDHKSAGGLIREIQALDADVINLHIDSYGGSVKEGWGMFNALREHKAKINTYADGFVASAALYPFLAGENRYASPVSAFYLHKVMGGAHGYAEDMREAADDLDKLTEIGIQAFVEVTGTDEKTILELMQKETWLDPKQALEMGICTAITRADNTQRYTQNVRGKIQQALIAGQEQKPQDQQKPEQKNPQKEEENPIIKLFS